MLEEKSSCGECTQEALNLLYRTWSPSRNSANSDSRWFPRDGRYILMRQVFLGWHLITMGGILEVPSGGRVM